MPNQYCQTVMKEKQGWFLDDILGHLHDPSTTSTTKHIVVTVCMLQNVVCIISGMVSSHAVSAK